VREGAGGEAGIIVCSCDVRIVKSGALVMRWWCCQVKQTCLLIQKSRSSNREAAPKSLYDRIKETALQTTEPTSCCRPVSAILRTHLRTIDGASALRPLSAPLHSANQVSTLLHTQSLVASPDILTTRLLSTWVLRPFFTLLSCCVTLSEIPYTLYTRLREATRRST
jgi:hypothetical protein